LKFKHGELAELLDLMVRQFGHNDLSAYLVMMAIRLVELHRVLKPTGSLYLHCDPTASHYLKMILDMIFGVENFRNEIVWYYGQRTSFHRGHFSKKHDIAFFYAKTKAVTINRVSLPWAKEDFIAHRHDVKRDEDGREFIWTDGGKAGVRYKRYVDDVLATGKPLDTVWNIPILNSAAKERLGYPTQKPLALLERIIKASSNPGDIVLDPFCGCGTAVHAAQKLGRQWIGIDITHLAIALIEKRLKDAFPGIQFTVEGTPKDLEGAKDLANRDKYQFQWWVCSLVNAQPYKGKTKGADSGIDGQIFFTDLEKGKPTIKKIIVSVKGGGNVGAAMVRDLVGTLQRTKAEIGLFVTLTPPTKPMEKEAAAAGFYRAGNGREYPRIQILTIEELLARRKRPEYWDMDMGELTFKKAQRESTDVVVQGELF
jgi:site-specific DNA-methyltransferase (adenine-specific)